MINLRLKAVSRTFLSVLVLCFISSRLAFAQTNEAHAWIVRGDSAYHAFDNKTALSFYERAFNSDTTAYLSHLNLSRTHYDFGLDLLAQNNREEAFIHFQESVRHANSLVQHFPDSSRAHFLYAATLGNLALFEGGREKVAIGKQVEVHSKKAIEIDSTWAYPYVALGVYYREVASLSWFERTLAKVFYGRLPNTSVQMALAYLKQAETLRPEFPFLHFELAITYQMLEQKQEARQHLRTLLGLAPETTQDIRNQEMARRMLVE